MCPRLAVGRIIVCKSKLQDKIVEPLSQNTPIEPICSQYSVHMHWGGGGCRVVGIFGDDL
jgi:hypothetical protein